jgi:hypothetical protein
LKEGPNPLQFTFEDWIDQERKEKSQLKNGLAYEKKRQQGARQDGRVVRWYLQQISFRESVSNDHRELHVTAQIERPETESKSKRRLQQETLLKSPENRESKGNSLTTND